LEATVAAVAGMAKTTLPNSISLGHQRREFTKVFVPALHHLDNLEKKDICGSDGQPRVLGEIIEWRKNPGDPVQEVFIFITYCCFPGWCALSNNK